MRTLSDLMHLDGRTALVTGGTGHIGGAMAEALAELGCAVALADLRADACTAAAAALTERYGVRATGVALNLEQEDEVRAAPGRVAEALGGLDIIVNCAAFVGTSGLEGWVTTFEKQSIATWRRALEVNLTAPTLLVQAALPQLRAGGHGSVINVGSIYGLVGPDWGLYEGTAMGNPAAYAASKGGLMQMTRWLATTLAPDVRVNAIAPGGVERNTPEPFFSRYSGRTPLGRMGREEDFKGAAAFLASDQSAWMTGQCLVIDGGWTVW